MRRLAVLSVLLVAAPAAADVSIVKGGPRGDARGLADGALAEAAKAMAVCWRAPTKGPVRVAITVGGDGAVTARAVTKGAAAQCAAGVLAVWSIPGGAWKGEVEIGAGSAAAADLATEIQQQLLAESASIKACQSRAPGKAGTATIKLHIDSDGRIDAAAVTSKLGADADQCIARAVRAIKLRPTGTAAGVNYQLAVAFSGHDGGTPPPPVEAPPPPGDGTTAGALAPGQVQTAVAAVRERIATCAGAAARGKRAGVRFTIRGDGTAKNIVIKESSGVAKLDDCIKDALGKATFPKAADETKVSVPLAF